MKNLIKCSCCEGKGYRNIKLCNEDEIGIDIKCPICNGIGYLTPLKACWWEIKQIKNIIWCNKNFKKVEFKSRKLKCNWTKETAEKMSNLLKIGV